MNDLAWRILWYLHKNPNGASGAEIARDSGVSVITRSWCKGADYWEVYFNLNETVYEMLKERGFMFPFNRVDVNILNNQTSK